MSDVYNLNHKQSEKKVREIREFLLELDSICDKLYDRLDYSGVWDALMKLEDVRVKYYTEFYEHDQIVRLRGKNGR